MFRSALRTHHSRCRILAVARFRALGVAVALMLVTTPALAGSQEPGSPPNPESKVQLAASFVDALNRGDAEGVVNMFDDEGTVVADRYAWLKFEIRLWARTQVEGSINLEQETPFEQQESRVAWRASVSRTDWRERGIPALQVANELLFTGEKIAGFTSKPLDVSAVEGLGDLWRPGRSPERRG